MRTLTVVVVVLLGLGVGVGLSVYGLRASPPPPPAPAPAPSPVPPADPRLEPYRQLLAAGHNTELLARLAELPGGVGYHAEVALGRSYRLRGELATALAWYERALARWPDPGAKQEYAELLEALGSTTRALAVWTELLPGRAAVAAVTRLAEPHTAAAALRRVRLYEEALAALGAADKPEVLLERARNQFGLRDYPAAIASFQAYLRARPGDGVARGEYALALERDRQYQAALTEYTALGTAGHYGRGRVLQALGRTDEAIAAYLAASDPEAQWRGAQLLEQGGAPNRALEVYTRLAATDARVADEAALRALLLHERAGRNDQARALIDRLTPALRWLSSRAPATWPLAADPEPVQPEAVAVATVLSGELGDWWALIEIELGLRGSGPAEQVAYGQWLFDNGHYHRSVRVGMGLVAGVPSPAAYRLAYPLAYRELVEATARAYRVDPFLVWAVMREESHFLPTALSWADARGLMQVIPPTGEWIAGKLSETFALENLFDPETSIRYGTWYLAHLLETFNDVALAVAAYNGGPGNVKRWTQLPPYRSTVDLPAVVTATETREYISKVLTSYLVYRWLYQQSSPSP